MHPIAVAILTSWDPPRLVRAIRSVQAQSVPCDLWVEINTESDDYRDQATAICSELGVESNVSKQAGTPGLGKQAVFDYFKKQRENPYLYLLDGDDWLYPCAVESLQRILAEMNLDVLTHLASDRIVERQSDPNQHMVGDGLIAHVWGDDNFADLPDPPGRGRASWLWDCPEVLVPGRTCFFSREATKLLNWNKRVDCYEDGLLYLSSLRLHQEGLLQSVNSLSQDVVLYDTTTPDSIQRRVDFKKSSDRLRRAVRRMLPEDRTSISELPSIRPRPFISYQEKLDYIAQTAPLVEPDPDEQARQQEATAKEAAAEVAGIKHNPTLFVFLRQRFAVETMNALVRYCEDVVGFSGGTFVDGNHRDNVKVCFLPRAEHPAATNFYNQLEDIATKVAPLLNVEVLPELIDNVQIARYLPGDHYGDHVDHDDSRVNLSHDRKLSIFGACSPGGALTVVNEDFSCHTGDVLVFPAITHHSAPEQYEGVRYSFVCWVPGPPWR